MLDADSSRGGSKEREKEHKERFHVHPAHKGQEGKGWSDVLHDWLALGKTSVPSPCPPGVTSAAMSTSTTVESIAPSSTFPTRKASADSAASREPAPIVMAWEEGKNGKPGRMVRIEEGSQGSYEFVVKERLQGIYLCKSLFYRARSRQQQLTHTPLLRRLRLEGMPASCQGSVPLNSTLPAAQF